jgi:hypothetical protein
MNIIETKQKLAGQVLVVERTSSTVRYMSPSAFVNAMAVLAKG